MPGLPPSGNQTIAAYKRYIPYAQNAGFNGQSLIQIMAIAFAESGLNPSAQNVNSDGSIDRGILQINSRWHPEVSDTCAYDPSCAFRASWTISQQGTNFGSWATYNHKTTSYNTGLADIKSVLSGQPLSDPGKSSVTAANGEAQGISLDPLAPFQAILNALPLFGIHIALFMFGIMLVIVGLWVLTRNPVNDTGSAFNAGLNKIVGGGK